MVVVEGCGLGGDYGRAGGLAIMRGSAVAARFSGRPVVPAACVRSHNGVRGPVPAGETGASAHRASDLFRPMDRR